jgi:OOP family OmpA-OmpF porin
MTAPYLQPSSIKASLILGVALLAGCASHEMLLEVDQHHESAEIDTYAIETYRRSIHIFDAVDLNHEIKYKQLKQKVENIIVLIDETAETDDLYRGVSKKTYAYEILRRFNETMPEISINGGVLSSLHSLSFSGISNNLFSNVDDDLFTPYIKSHVAKELNDSPHFNSIQSTDLASTLDKLGEMIVRMEGRTALILITQWENLNEDTAEAIMRLRQKTSHPFGLTVAKHDSHWQGMKGDGLCIYSIGIGNAMSRTRYDTADSCGLSIAADKVAQPRDMAHFIKRVLFTQPTDDDGDGIFNYLDKCPETPLGRLVNYDGCFLFSSGGH